MESNSAVFDLDRNLNEVGVKGAPLISIDDNCNLHVSGGRDSADSSPSRSHLSLALNTQVGHTSPLSDG